MERPWVAATLGLLDLGLGRAEDALARLETLAEGRRFFHIPPTRSTPDLVEAAVRLGRPEEATAPLALFETWSRNIAQPWAAALVHRCRALLDGDEHHFRPALSLYEQGDRPFDEARTRLLYGEWLRREKRKADARVHLGIALEAFAGRCRPVGGPGSGRAHRDRDAGRSAGHGPAGEPHAAGTADRPAGRAGREQQGHRRAADPQPPHGRPSPVQGVPEARGDSRGELADLSSAIRPRAVRSARGS